MVQPDIDPAIQSGFNEAKFDFGRNGDRGMALGIAGIAFFFVSCCISCVPYVGVVGCCTNIVALVCGVLGLMWGKKGLNEVAEGLQPIGTRGRAQAGFITGLAATILAAIYLLTFVVIIVLAIVGGFSIAILQGL
jgi:hypothetical protein